MGGSMDSCTWRMSREYRSKRSAHTGTCIREPTEAVAPVSAMTRGTSSSFLARMAAAAALSRANRSSAGVAAQPGRASRAASAACSASRTEASGAWPTTCSVAGLTMS